MTMFNEPTYIWRLTLHDELGHIKYEVFHKTKEGAKAAAHEHARLSGEIIWEPMPGYYDEERTERGWWPKDDPSWEFGWYFYICTVQVWE
jgi:hypothetical protein